jgi:hypothetical protein
VRPKPMGKPTFSASGWKTSQHVPAFFNLQVDPIGRVWDAAGR